MKRTLLLLLTIVSAIQVIAAPKQKSLSNTVAHTPHTNGGNKTTAALKRLIAYGYIANGVAVDSERYYYSGGRGSDIARNAFSDDYRPNSYADYQAIKSDKTIKWSASGGTMMQTRVKNYTYDAQNRVITMRDSAATSYKYNVYYKANGLRDSVKMDYNNLGPTAKTFFYYNGASVLMADSVSSLLTFTPVSKNTYVLDASNNVIEYYGYANEVGIPLIPVWNISYHYVYTYDAKNRNTTTTAQAYNFTTKILEYTTRDSFVYNGNDTVVAAKYESEWNKTTSSWQFKKLTTYTYNTAGYVASYMLHDWVLSKWDTLENDIYTYDSNNLLLRINGYKYTGSGNFSTTPYDQTTLHYEDYFPASVGKTNIAANISLSPNPAINTLSVNTGSYKTASYTITDMQGRLVSKQENINTGTYSINTSKLSPGNYILNVYDEQNSIVAQKQFIKQ